MNHCTELVNNACISSSDRPFVSGTKKYINTIENAETIEKMKNIPWKNERKDNQSLITNYFIKVKTVIKFCFEKDSN